MKRPPKRVEEIQGALIGTCADDLEAALKIIAGIEMAKAAGQALVELLELGTELAAEKTSIPGRCRRFGIRFPIGNRCQRGCRR